MTTDTQAAVAAALMQAMRDVQSHLEDPPYLGGNRVIVGGPQVEAVCNVILDLIPADAMAALEAVKAAALAGHEGTEPPCDISGRCEVHDDDEKSGVKEAMCIYCGGWRYRDTPRPGNWGTSDHRALLPQATGGDA